MVNIYEKVIRAKQEKYIEYLKSKTNNFANIILISTEKIGLRLFNFLSTQIDISELYILDSSNKGQFMDNQVRIKTSLSQFESKKDETVCIIGSTKRNEQILKIKLLRNDFKNIIDSPIDLLEILEMGTVPFNRRIIEITTKVGCSINCKYCPQRLFVSRYNDNNGDIKLSISNFIKILNHLPNDTIIDFAGMSEPFLNPDTISMIEICNKRHYPVFLATTLVGVKTEDIERFKKLKISYFCLHLPDEDNFSNIPVNDSYIRVLDEILEFRKDDGRRFVDTTNCHGTLNKKVRELIKGRIDINENVELNDRAGNLTTLSNNISKKGMIACCNQSLFDRFVVLPNGTVLLCCMDYGMQHIMGNLLDEDYNAILHGKEYKKIMDDAVLNNSNTICRKCVAAIDCTLY